MRIQGASRWRSCATLGPLGQWPGIANQGPGIGSDRPRSDGIGSPSPVLTGRTLQVVCTKKARGKCAFWNAHDTWPVGNENILITTYCAWVPRPIKVIRQYKPIVPESKIADPGGFPQLGACAGSALTNT